MIDLYSVLSMTDLIKPKPATLNVPCENNIPAHSKNWVILSPYYATWLFD